MSKIGDNTLEGRAKAMADRIECLQIEIEAEQEECKTACAPMREDIAEIWKEAKGGELPEKAMRAYVKVRTAQRKALAKMNAPEREAYERLRDALGPLGAAAAERAGYHERTTMTITSTDAAAIKAACQAGAQVDLPTAQDVKGILSDDDADVRPRFLQPEPGAA